MADVHPWCAVCGIRRSRSTKIRNPENPNNIHRCGSCSEYYRLNKHDRRGVFTERAKARHAKKWDQVMREACNA